MNKKEETWALIPVKSLIFDSIECATVKSFVLIINMTEQLRQQLKVLLNTFAEQRNDIEIYVDKIIELFQENDQIHPATNEQHRRRRSSIFDNIPICPPENAVQRRRSSTYSEQGLVKNFNTVLYNNRDID
jgi:bifunctional N-acetylglucosamine-1-phosphate-uridyltransferase/glucosamine-1-phosphate-acetyltransferase GlmU-like protein